MKKIEQTRKVELLYMQSGIKVAIFNIEYFELDKEQSKVMCTQLHKIGVLTSEEWSIMLRYIDSKL